MNKIWVLGLLLILSAVSFANNLHGEFMIDDFDLVNHQQPLTFAGFSGDGVYYRPFAHLLPYIESLAFGQNTFGYHVSNLILFALACFCFYLLFAQLTGDKKVALIAAALFCVHPLNGLMVNYITASVYAVQLIFLSLCALFYMRKNILFLSLSMLAFVGALLCHETSIMLPTYLFLISWYQQRSFKLAIKKVIPFLVIALLYMGLRLHFTTVRENVLMKGIFYTDLNFLNYIATFAKLIVWYFEKFITLHGIVIIWSTPLAKDFLWLWFMGVVIAMGTVIYLLFKWCNDIKQIFLLWFVLGLPPVILGCMFLPQTGFMIEPHWLFFPSFGLFALLSMALLAIAKKISPAMRLCSFVLLLIGFLIASWQNNALWKDELTFTRHWVAMAPTNKNAAFCLGHALLQRGDNQQAKKWFLSSLMNTHTDWQNYTNLASISLQEQDEAQALIYFQKALEIFPQSAVTYNNLGAYYLRKKDFNKAEECLLRANTFAPYQIETLLNLGLAAENKGKIEEAVRVWQKAIRLNPNDQRPKDLLRDLEIKKTQPR